MKQEKGKTAVLQACMAKAVKLNSLIEYAADSIVSKTIIDKPIGTITLFAFDKGQKLTEHTTPFDAVVQVIDGFAKLTIGNEGLRVSTGEIIIMPAKIPHAVTAEQKFKMLLTMIRA